jgi:hypothetical protein
MNVANSECPIKSIKKIREKFQQKVEYDFKQFQGDDQVLQSTQPYAYCLKVCNKIGYYLQVVHGIEILRMTVEFF